MATVADDVRDRAFERMYEHYVRDVYRYVLAVLRNPADAEDVTQTTFMNAYRAFQRGERPHKPQNWLISIAHNACRTKATRASRRPKEIPLDDVVMQLAVPESEKPNIRELLKALGRLPFNQRAAIAMRELEGRSYQEIAETLNVSVPAVEALIVRARRTLRAQRTAVRGLTAVQLPRSLRSLFESSDATTAVAGGLVGGGVLAKAAAVLIAGAVAGGVGYTGVEAGIAKRPGSAPARLEHRALTAAHVSAPALPRKAVVSRPKRAEPTGMPRRPPAAPVATTGVAVVPGGATAPTTHAPVADTGGAAPQPEPQPQPQPRPEPEPEPEPSIAAADEAPGADRPVVSVSGLPDVPASPPLPPLPVEPPAVPQAPELPQPALPALPAPPPAPELPKTPELPRIP
jgi:RNA polymerase sigma factor (sigma-70 family)